MKLDRRTAMIGLAGLMAGPFAFAESTSPVAHGVLANNALAKSFQKARSDLPDVKIVGPDGVSGIHTVLKGRTVLMPLWAEWCAPCLSEIPDFAKLQRKYGNDKFAILPVLTGTHKQMTPATITAVFKVLHAAILPPLMESHYGDKLIETMARMGDRYAIPCNLLIAPDGHVVGREIGRESAPDASAGPAPAKTPDAETVTRAIAGQAQSLWGEPAGEQFAAAMAAGFLG